MRSGGAGVALCHCCQLPASKLGFTRTAANDSGWHLADGMCNGTVTPLRVFKMKAKEYTLSNFKSLFPSLLGVMHSVCTCCKMLGVHI